jgi:hypothetical protein
MLIPIVSVTSDALCPDVLGGVVGRYPQTIGGVPITMPGPGGTELNKPPVLFALSGRVYLARPRVGQQNLLTPCPTCVRAHRALTRMSNSVPMALDTATRTTVPNAVAAAATRTEWTRQHLVSPLAG